ncbi:hypothetical protein PGTUg99_011603 [Puccinia graminis f. sp. tritici]|uniref:Uncharacterized protein n=1 Tax=Puccinia graminis f. sp. tritici TaxID=56615 RepID=A0A5B0QGW5_PUCGR|nr:hypothetical protein PGTUg99_011603 [Puccinia graminis f. sp. tritici]
MFLTSRDEDDGYLILTQSSQAEQQYWCIGPFNTSTILSLNRFTEGQHTSHTLYQSHW